MKKCKRCGDEREPDTLCSRCGGHGLIGYDEPRDCPDCGCSGVQWPPRCRGCGAFRQATYEPTAQEWDDSMSAAS